MEELITQTDFAKKCGVTPQAISKAIRKDGLPFVQKGRRLLIDLKDRKIKRYLKEKEQSKEDKKSSLEHKTKANLSIPSTGPLSMERAAQISSGMIDDDVPDEYWQDQIRQGNLESVPKAIAEKIKIVEQINKIRIETEQKRNQLIPRDLVKNVISQMYAIDVNELRTMPAKSSQDMATIFGINEPALILEAERKLEEEIFKILEHIRRKINVFLTSVEEKEIKRDPMINSVKSTKNKKKDS